ncbi:MAG: hypothetical protein VYC34_02455 [Planctomycetota bacterium]|nr:hypothetical protein [Planctomycetota bacterium]
MNRITIAVASAAVAISASAQAQDIYLSMLDNIGVELGGLTFTDGDVVRYNPGADTASVFHSESLITPGNDITAFHLLPNGNYLLSVLFNGRTLGGLTFDDGDLVEYDPVNDVASIFGGISESSFANNADISGVSIAANGVIVLSTLEDNTLGGLSYTDGDLIGYDTMTGLASLLIAEADLFDDGDGDIDAVHALETGNYVISFATDTESISGTMFRDGDLVEYNPFTDTASLYFSEDLFTDTANGHDINAVFIVPAPASGLLLGAAPLALIRRRRR